MRALISVTLSFMATGMAWGGQLPTGTTRAESAPITNPLKAHSSNPNYFADGRGKAVYLTGSHTWNDFQDWGTDDSPQPFDFAAYVKMLVAHHHNFTLLWQTELPVFRGLPTQANAPTRFLCHPAAMATNRSKAGVGWGIEVRPYEIQSSLL